MATLQEIRQQYPQYADVSDADLASALHKKFYADMPRDAFDAKLGLASPEKKDDIYTTAAKTDIAAADAAGAPSPGLTRRALQGMTFGAADEVLAGLSTPLEMIRRGTFNPAEGYRYAKARENADLDRAREKTGAFGTAVEMLGGAGSGLGLARGGLTAARMLAPNAGLLSRAGASAADGAGIGLFSGAMEGDGLGDRAANAAQGGIVGGALGGSVPLLLGAGQAALAPVMSNIRARMNPEGYARSQVARAITEAGQTPAQLASDVSRAAQEGQGMFALADAMGNPGQRMLSTVARAPGPGRTEVVEFLENRQAGQGRRIVGALAEGFDSPRTADQTRAAMTGARDTAADTAFEAARNNAAPVDVSNVIATIDRTLRPGVNQIARPQSGIANDSIESALDGFRARLTDGRSVQTDFTAIQRVRDDISDAAQAAQQSGHGNKARMLRQVLRELDASMERASQGYRAANRNFEQASRNIDAIDDGAAAATRGRSEDVIPTFNSLTPEGQTGFRAGYVDPLIQQAQGAAFGVNKARPLINDAFQAEGAAIAPGNPLMQRRIGRENTMFETRNHAIGNSRTADNLADADAMGIDPSVVGQVLTGNFSGALRSMLSAGSNALTGNTAEVRHAVGELLLQRGQNLSSAHVQRLLDDAVRRIQGLQLVAQRMGQTGRGGLGGLATAPAATQNDRR